MASKQSRLPLENSANVGTHTLGDYRWIGLNRHLLHCGSECVFVSDIWACMWYNVIIGSSQALSHLQSVNRSKWSAELQMTDAIAAGSPEDVIGTGSRRGVIHPPLSPPQSAFNWVAHSAKCLEGHPPCHFRWSTAISVSAEERCQVVSSPDLNIQRHPQKNKVWGWFLFTSGLGNSGPQGLLSCRV